MAEITPKEQGLFEQAIRHGDLDRFTEYFFQLPRSGTRYTTDDHRDQYSTLYTSWRQCGRPDDKFSVLVGDKMQEFIVEWDSTYYGDYPVFLLPHGFRMLPWLEEFLDPRIPLGIAITGTGTGKTAGLAIWGLTMCALYPGFRYLNVAPSRVQAELMLNEIEKWCSNTLFRKFIQESPRGAHPLWVSRPHAVLTVEVYDGYPSVFVCQTVNRDARTVLGQEQDVISCDEAQLLENIDEATPILSTRLRGSRITGATRLGLLRWISNPGKNAELIALMEHYRTIQADSNRAIVLEGIHSSANIYVTKAQLERQLLSLPSQRAMDRWHGGLTSAVYSDQEISEELLNQCRDKHLDDEIEHSGEFDDLLGLRHFSLPYKPDHTYVVTGDVGKSDAATMSSMNIPCVMVFDITSFLHQPIILTAFHWFDGLGSYDGWLRTMQAMMLRYNATGYYDATSVQTAFEDVRDAAFDGWPTTPVYFSGSVVPKRWSLAIVTKLMGDSMFRWPYIKALWHQARIYDPRSTKIPDDIIATLMVFGLALRAEDTLWTQLEERYKWKLEDDDELRANAFDDFSPHTKKPTSQADRYARLPIG